MNRFAIEHLPKANATYRVTPVHHDEARAWLAAGQVTSLVRTTELMGAIGSGLGATLDQSDTSMALQPGDEALFISVSYSVLLAWAQGGIVPLPEDWRCLLLSVLHPTHPVEPSPAAAAIEPQVAD